MVNRININMLIEIKNELNELIIEDLSSCVFDGILEIYNGSKQLSNSTTIMKTFQKCMEKICEWDDSKVQNVIGIVKKKINSEEKFMRLQNMIKANLRINVQIMNNNSSVLEEELLRVDKITLENFIRKVYVESAKRIWSQPYLFYEKSLSQIEIKRNYIIIISLIKESILSAIRKLIISKNTIDLILSNTYQIEKTPVAENKYSFEQSGGNLNNKDEILNIIDKNLKVSESDKSTFQLNNNAFDNYTPRNQNVSEAKSSSTLKKIVNESFDNKNSHNHNDRHTSHKNDRYSSYNSSYHNDRHSSKYSDRHSSHHNDRHSSHHNDRHSSRNSRHSTRYNTATNNISIDTNVKNNLIKDLMTESVSYKPENGNDNYQDIFSNSEVPDNTNRKTSKNTNRDKEHFYNNYLKK